MMHYGGAPGDPELVSIAEEHGLALIEDAAHAPGAAGPPGRCGSWGAAGCFSFFANKNLPLGEGGMVTTDDPEIAEAALRLRSHGMTSATWERHTGGASSYDVPRPGFNMRLTEMVAAMGAAMLPHLDSENERRGRLVERYRSALGTVDGVSMPFSSRPPGERSAHHLAAVVLDAGIDRARVVESMHGAGIQTSVHYPPTHALSAHGAWRADVAMTDALAPRLLTLPLYPHLEPAQVDEVVAALRAALAAPGAGRAA